MSSICSGSMCESNLSNPYFHTILLFQVWATLKQRGIELYLQLSLVSVQGSGLRIVLAHFQLTTSYSRLLETILTSHALWIFSAHYTLLLLLTISAFLLNFGKSLPLNLARHASSILSFPFCLHIHSPLSKKNHNLDLDNCLLTAQLDK